MLLPGAPVHETGPQAVMEWRGAERSSWAKPGQGWPGGSRSGQGQGLQDVCDDQQRRDGLLQQRRRLVACCVRNPLFGRKKGKLEGQKHGRTSPQVGLPA